MAARVAGPTKTEHGLAPDANNDAIDTASPIAAYLAAWPTGPTTAGPVSTPMRSADPPPASWPNCIRQAARQRTLRVVLVRYGHAKDSFQARPGDRGDCAAKRFHLGDQAGQRLRKDLLQLFWAEALIREEPKLRTKPR